uniref:partitioning defective 3 homolog isoform X2 n=1 Tax=Myxine glutinosa TaxID=7769 RepID=UPI00358E51C6
MKVTVCFGRTRIVVPCGDGRLSVRDLIVQATTRYRKAIGKDPAYWVHVQRLEHSDGGILDGDDLVGTVADDKDKLLAVFEDQDGLRGGDVASISSSDTTQSPESFGSDACGPSSLNPSLALPSQSWDTSSGRSSTCASRVPGTPAPWDAGGPPSWHARGSSLNDLAPFAGYGTCQAESEIEVTPSTLRSSNPLHVRRSSDPAQVALGTSTESGSPSVCASLTPTDEACESGLAWQARSRTLPKPHHHGVPESFLSTSAATIPRAKTEVMWWSSSSAASELNLPPHRRWARKHGGFQRDPSRLSISTAHPMVDSWLEKQEQDHEEQKEGDKVMERTEPLGRASYGSRVDACLRRAANMIRLLEFGNDKTPLGIHLVPFHTTVGRMLGLCVRQAEEGGRARRENLLRPGDCIVAINGYYLNDVTFELAQHWFRQAMQLSMMRLAIVPAEQRSRYRHNAEGASLIPMEKLAAQHRPSPATDAVPSPLVDRGPLYDEWRQHQSTLQLRQQNPRQPSSAYDYGVPQCQHYRPVVYQASSEACAGQDGKHDRRIVEVSEGTPSLFSCNGLAFEGPAHGLESCRSGGGRQTGARTAGEELLGLVATGLRVGRQFRVQLQRGSEGLGFSITSRDTPVSGLGPIYIKHILPRGAALADGRLRAGDRLLQVNGLQVDGLSQVQVAALLRGVPPNGSVDLLISRQEELPPQEQALPGRLILTAAGPCECLAFEIVLGETGAAGLGVSVKGTRARDGGPDLGIFVKSIITGGAAARDGRLRVNDQLVAVNGESLLGHSNPVAMEMLRRSLATDGSLSGRIQLVVARRPEARDEAVAVTPLQPECPVDPGLDNSNHLGKTLQQCLAPSSLRNNILASTVHNEPVSSAFCHESRRPPPPHDPGPAAPRAASSLGFSSISAMTKISPPLAVPIIPHKAGQVSLPPADQAETSEPTVFNGTQEEKEETSPSCGLFEREGFGRQSVSERRGKHLVETSQLQAIRARKSHSMDLDHIVGPTLGLKKSSSLESLQTAVVTATLVAGGDDSASALPGSGSHSARSRGCNDSFRVAIDKSYTDASSVGAVADRIDGPDFVESSSAQEFPYESTQSHLELRSDTQGSTADYPPPALPSSRIGTSEEIPDPTITAASGSDSTSEGTSSLELNKKTSVSTNEGLCWPAASLSDAKWRRDEVKEVKESDERKKGYREYPKQKGKPERKEKMKEPEGKERKKSGMLKGLGVMFRFGKHKKEDKSGKAEGSTLVRVSRSKVVTQGPPSVPCGSESTTLGAEGSPADMVQELEGMLEEQVDDEESVEMETEKPRERKTQRVRRETQQGKDAHRRPESWQEGATVMDDREGKEGSARTQELRIGTLSRLSNQDRISQLFQEFQLRRREMCSPARPDLGERRKTYNFEQSWVDPPCQGSDAIDVHDRDVPNERPSALLDFQHMQQKNQRQFLSLPRQPRKLSKAGYQGGSYACGEGSSMTRTLDSAAPASSTCAAPSTHLRSELSVDLRLNKSNDTSMTTSSSKNPQPELSAPSTEAASRVSEEVPVVPQGGSARRGGVVTSRSFAYNARVLQETQELLRQEVQRRQGVKQANGTCAQTPGLPTGGDHENGGMKTKGNRL